MADIQKEPKEMTRDELLFFVRQTIQEELRIGGYTRASRDLHKLLNLQPLSVGKWQGTPNFIERDDFYDDTGS